MKHCFHYLLKKQDLEPLLEQNLNFGQVNNFSTLAQASVISPSSAVLSNLSTTRTSS